MLPGLYGLSPTTQGQGVPCPYEPSRGRASPGPQGQMQLVRGLFGYWGFDAVLLFPVADSRLDGVFGKHRTVNLYRRERQLAHDVRVLDRKSLLDRFAFDPFGGE